MTDDGTNPNLELLERLIPLRRRMRDITRTLTMVVEPENGVLTQRMPVLRNRLPRGRGSLRG